MRKSLGLGTPRVSGLGTPGSLWGWARQGVSGVDTSVSGDCLGLGSLGRPGEEKSSGRGEELSLKSNNPTPKVGNKTAAKMHSVENCTSTSG